MTLKLVVVATLLAVQSITATPYVEKRSGSVCQSGIYGELAPILVQYPIAQAFCTAVYPVKCTSAGYAPKKRSVTTTTLSKTSTSSNTPTTKTTTTLSTTKPTTSRTTSSTTTQDAKASAWSKCQGQPANVISTMCSCIESPKPCPSSSTTTSTTPKTTSSTTSSPTSSTTRSTTPSTTPTTTPTTTSSTTSSSTTTTCSSAPTAFPPGPYPTCGVTAEAYCDSEAGNMNSACICSIRYDGGNPICWSAIICPYDDCGNAYPCTSDDQCVAANPETPYCVYYDNGCNGPTTCVGYNGCANDVPQKIRRDILSETVLLDLRESGSTRKLDRPSQACNYHLLAYTL